jgi:hypothetical protein
MQELANRAIWVFANRMKKVQIFRFEYMARLLTLAALLLFLMGLATGQSGDQSSQIPDAPSASKPPQFPSGTAPAPKNPERPLPPNDPVPSSEADEASPLPPPPAAIPNLTTESRAGNNNSRDDFVIKVPVNLVVVPVTVKDPSGQLVDGLLRKDFIVRENGVEQRLTLFTSDPFPLSVAVVLDANLPANVMKKLNETLPALAGAVGPFY